MPFNMKHIVSRYVLMHVLELNVSQKLGKRGAGRANWAEPPRPGADVELR